MKQYKKLLIRVIKVQHADILTASGEYESTSYLKDWFSGYFTTGGGE